MNEPPLGAVIVALHWIPAFVVIYSGQIQKMDCAELFLYCFRGANCCKRFNESGFERDIISVAKPHVYNLKDPEMYVLKSAPY